jgi:hypothetical protein
MTTNKRPSTSSLRRFISSRPYVAIAELRRRFVLDQPDAMSRLERNGTVVWVGLPEREASKILDLWLRDEIGLQLSVEVRAPVVIGIFPMRIARHVIDGISFTGSNGHAPTHRVDGYPQPAPTHVPAFGPPAGPPSYAHALGPPKPTAASE